jgi:NAD(P)-dependent dehydrogenase (short-subunit alcohol dehydrogenase family)
MAILQDRVVLVTARTPVSVARTPLRDIAAAGVPLASPGARNITEQAYNVDGGLVPS